MLSETEAWAMRPDQVIAADCWSKNSNQLRARNFLGFQDSLEKEHLGPRPENDGITTEGAHSDGRLSIYTNELYKVFIKSKILKRQKK